MATKTNTDHEQTDLYIVEFVNDLFETLRHDDMFKRLTKEGLLEYVQDYITDQKEYVGKHYKFDLDLTKQQDMDSIMNFICEYYDEYDTDYEEDESDDDESEKPLSHDEICCLKEKFDEYVNTDSDGIKGYTDLYVKWRNSDDFTKKLIDDILIMVCGYSMSTMIKQVRGCEDDE